MRIIPDQLKSKNLVPFKKRHGRYIIPGMARENQISMDRVDSDLSPEEQGYIRHYLGYADALIRSAEENAPPHLGEGNFTESVLSIDQRLQEQIDQSPAEIPNELSPATDDASHKAA